MSGAKLQQKHPFHSSVAFCCLATEAVSKKSRMQPKVITVIKQAIQVSGRLFSLFVCFVFLHTQVCASEAVHRSPLCSLFSWDIKGTWLKCSLLEINGLKTSFWRSKKEKILQLWHDHTHIPPIWSRVDVTMATVAVGQALVNTIKCSSGAAGWISTVVLELVRRGTSGVWHLPSNVLAVTWPLTCPQPHYFPHLQYMTEELSPCFPSSSLLPSLPVLGPAGVGGGLAFVAVQESGHDD